MKIENEIQIQNWEWELKSCNLFGVGKGKRYA